MSRRISEDITVNPFGRKLLQLCKSTGLRICNGRSPGDKSGKLTFYNHRGTSVIDYVLAEADHFDIVSQLNVGEFNEWSDHAPLEFQLKCMSVNTHNSIDTITKGPNTTHKHRWDEAHVEQMKRDLEDRVSDLYRIVDSIQSSSVTLDQGIDQFNSVLNTVFQPCCRTVKCSCNTLPIRRKHTDKDKPWFDEKCKHLYNNYRHYLHIFNSDRSSEHRCSLIEAKGEYKRYERQARRKYLRSEGNRINLLRKINPKQFHKAFKKKSRSPITSLSLDNFFEHFKSVCNNDVDTDHNLGDQTECYIFNELDAPISREEVCHALKKTKAGKSPGVDNLLNEYFSKFCDTFTPLLSRLFNIIFDQGIFPTCWSEGIIFPSFKKGDANDTNNYRGITLVSCLSKIFTSVINSRLLKWSDENNIVSDAQFGFKPGLALQMLYLRYKVLSAEHYLVIKSYFVVLSTIKKLLIMSIEANYSISYLGLVSLVNYLRLSNHYTAI